MQSIYIYIYLYIYENHITRHKGLPVSMTTFTRLPTWIYDLDHHVLQQIRPYGLDFSQLKRS